MDTAGHIRIIEFEDTKVMSNSDEILPRSHKVQKVLFLKNLGIELIICGAVSRHLHQLLISSGIEVIPFIHGSINIVLEAYENGELSAENILNQRSKSGYWCHGQRRYRRRSDFDR